MATTQDCNASSNNTTRFTVFNAVDWVALILVIVGGINWGLIGAFQFDLVAAIFGVMSSVIRIAYVLVGIVAVYCITLLARLGR